MAIESFEGMTPGSTPAGWAATATGTGTILVSTANPRVGTQGIVSAENSGSTRTWIVDPTSRTDDEEVSLDVYHGGPLGVFARGSGMGSAATATCYACSTVGGPTLSLYKLVNGVRTLLRTVVNGAFTGSFIGSGAWVRITLRVNGSNIRVKLYSYAKDQYFNSFGGVQADECWAINLTDATIAAGTAVGIIRDAQNGTVTYADEYEAASVAGINSTPPTIAITAPAASATLAGASDITVAAGASTVSVEYWIDGVLRHRADSAPYTWRFDSTLVDNGTRSIVANAIDAEGNIGISAAVAFTASNSKTATLPSPPVKHPWVSVYSHTGQNPAASQASLDWYEGWLSWAMNQQNNTILGALDAADPTCLSAVYDNLTNTYLDSLLSWCEYADANGVDREEGFYHGRRARSNTVASWSSGMPGERFWYLLSLSGSTYTDSANRNAFTAQGTTTLPGADQSLYLGYPERHEKIRFTLTTANSGYAYAVEYATAVDGNRAATAWGTLAVTDGTAGFTATGELTFDPPSDWVAARLVAGSTAGEHKYCYWVRLRTTTTGGVRAVGRLTTTNWEGCGDGQGGAGKAPSLRPAYGTLAPWARYRSRDAYGTYGTFRDIPRVTTAAVRDWFVSEQLRKKSEFPLLTGFFLDNQGGNWPGASPFDVREPVFGYLEDLASFTNQLWVRTGCWYFQNVAGSSEPQILRLLALAPVMWDEGQIHSLSDTASAFLLTRSEIAGRAAVATYTSGAATPYQLIDCDDDHAPLEFPDATVTTAAAAATTTAFRLANGPTLSLVANGKKAYCYFTSGNLVGGGRKQVDTHNTATGEVTFATPWSEAPAHGDHLVFDGEDADGIFLTSMGSSPTVSTHALGTDAVAYQHRRLEEGSLAYFYLVRTDPQRCVLGTFQDSSVTNCKANFIRFLAWDVGTATEAAPTAAWATGTDPSNGVAFSVFKRDYSLARIVHRTRSNTSATIGNATAATVALGGTYKRVVIGADGVTPELAATPISSISLRNGEGAILVPFSSDGPTSATITGPTSGVASEESAAFTVTLDFASVGTTTVGLASSDPGDVFRATSGGGTVTSIDIADGQQVGTFYLVPDATTGARTITPTASGIAFTPSSRGYTASAAGSATPLLVIGTGGGLLVLRAG